MNSLRELIFPFLLILEYVYADYWCDRRAILSKEACRLVGSSIKLTEKERKVNEILMTLKLKEYDEGFADPSKFLPSQHFFNAKPAIERSEVFKFIQQVPKGASLHSHSSAMVSFDFLFNLTYSHPDRLYGCNKNGTFKLRFFVTSVDSSCQWKLLSEWRKDPGFDGFLKSQLTLVVKDPSVYSDLNKVWTKFEKIFSSKGGLFKYRPFLRDYLLQVFKEFHEDNVMYLEIRGGFGETFDSQGVVYDALDTPQFYLNVLQEFRRNNPQFLGFRFIYAKFRKASKDQLAKYIQDYLKFQQKYPELIAGFDLVGQEDIKPLIDHADQLLRLLPQTKFFFHAGETNWNGSPTDLNLVDAVLLNTSRIGHGFALSKHVEVLRLVKEKNVAIELNPISNQVLKLVDDIRNHVGTSLIAGGYPVVITCDDPTLWGAKGLSYDWYMTFMGMVPRGGDLKVLKQLAVNSLVYSSLDSTNRTYYLAQFERQWGDFLNKILEIY